MMVLGQGGVGKSGECLEKISNPEAGCVLHNLRIKPCYLSTVGSNSDNFSLFLLLNLQFPINNVL